MAKTISVPKDLLESTREFVSAEGIALEVVTDGCAEVCVVPGAMGEESNAAQWRAGGWIGCGAALEAADRLGIARPAVGKLLDHVNIKIRACELGCF